MIAERGEDWSICEGLQFVNRSVLSDWESRSLGSVYRVAGSVEQPLRMRGMGGHRGPVAQLNAPCMMGIAMHFYCG